MNVAKLLPQISGNKVVIWGARMTGLGAFRKLQSLGISTSCFIDSDVAFSGKTVSGLPVYSPQEFSLWLGQQTSFRSDQFVILLAVSIKEDDVRRSLVDAGLGECKVVSITEPNEYHYTIDILGSCNLACASCPHSIAETTVPKGAMSYDTFKLVVEKMRQENPLGTHVSLYSWGEPLIHPKIAEIVRFLHENDLAVALSSNLSLKIEKKLEALIRESPEYLKVSVSGYFPHIYNNTHQGGDVNLVKGNLYKLRHFIDTYKANTLVDINYHMYRDNVGEDLVQFRALANELGFVLSTTYALVMPLERTLSFLAGAPDKQTLELQGNLLVNIHEGIAASRGPRAESKGCAFRENQININSDLTVPVCCTVWERDGKLVAGNYLDSSITEIAKNKANVSVCSVCEQAGLPEYNMGFNRAEWDAVARRNLQSK